MQEDHLDGTPRDNCPGEGLTVKNIYYPPYIPML